MNPWSKVGVAMYPPKFPVVGQNRIYNALIKFKQSFSNHDDLSGFFVIVGDWGLGKTRLGYELVAEIADHVDQWLLDPKDYIAPNTNRRVLEPQLAEGILPLFIDVKGKVNFPIWGNLKFPTLPLRDDLWAYLRFSLRCCSLRIDWSGNRPSLQLLP